MTQPKNQKRKSQKESLINELSEFHGRPMYFGMDGKPLKLMEWAKMFQNTDRHVGSTKLWGGLFWVSTVLLGVDHNFSFKGPPIIFESMVFCKWCGLVDWFKYGYKYRKFLQFSGSEIDMDRYSTKKQAVLGHKRLVKNWGTLNHLLGHIWHTHALGLFSRG